MKKALVSVLTAGALALTALSAHAVEQIIDPKGKTVQEMRQPIPLSLARVHKVLGQKGVYLLDCNPDEIYQKSHLPGAIHANIEDWTKLLPEDKKNSFIILYCINRMCNVSFEASLVVIDKGYENVYVMPDGIQGWVSHGYEFEGTGRRDSGLASRNK